ncbi:MAG: hypothetical protein DWQ11_08800 [Proteobacteria bacterium]|nr:MAG: hypothetical protein DWQ11_08800 [Pseudomonadota bacterium]
MGTLFDQPRREMRSVATDQIDSFLQELVTLSKKHGVPVADVIAAANVLQLKRKNDLAVGNGDVFDEQMASLGEVIREVASALRDIKSPG